MAFDIIVTPTGKYDVSTTVTTGHAQVRFSIVGGRNQPEYSKFGHPDKEVIITITPKWHNQIDYVRWIIKNIKVKKKIRVWSNNPITIAGYRVTNLSIDNPVV